MIMYKMNETAQAFVEAAYGAMANGTLYHLESENSFLRTIHETQDGTEIALLGCLVYAPGVAEHGSFPFVEVEEIRGFTRAVYRHTSQGLAYTPPYSELEFMHEDGTIKTDSEIKDEIFMSRISSETGKKFYEYLKVERALCAELGIESLSERQSQAKMLAKRGRDTSHIDTEHEHPEIVLLRELYGVDEIEAAYKKEQAEKRIAEELMGVRDVEANIQRITFLLRSLGPRSIIYSDEKK